MGLESLFEDMKECVAEPARRKRVGATTNSIALIANNGGTGCVLECDGSGIEASLDDVGKALDDNGLDDAPDGLSIWEGRYVTTQHNSIDYGIDYDAELIGTFRDLTEREWALLRETGTPWEFEPVPTGGEDR